MRKLNVLVVTILAVSVGVSSTPIGQAQESTATEKAADAPKSFTHVVIADLPPILSGSMEALAKRFAALAGTAMTPQWWRLDMAAFETATPLAGDKLAENLGLTIISDVADTLILAPTETPKAIKAEARLFIMSLFGNDHKGVWKQAASALDGGGRNGSSMSSWGVGIGQVIVRRGMSGREEPQPAVIPGADALSIEGALNDPKVIAALNLDEEALKRPMKHYTIADFSVRPAMISEEDSNQSYTTFRIGGMDYEEGGNAARGIIITAREGTARTDIPTGPECDLGLDGSGGDILGARTMMGFAGLFMGWGWAAFGNQWMWDGGWGRNRQQTESKEDDPFYVALRLDNFCSIRKPDAARVAELEKALALLGDDTKTSEERARLTLDLVKERDFGYAPRRKIWVDRSATALMKDEPDEKGMIRQAKRILAERTAKMIKDFVDRQGANAVCPEGNLGDWQLRNSYGLQDHRWDYFNVPPYEDSMLMLNSYKGSDPALKGNMILTVAGVAISDYAFELRIHPSSGNVVWLQGEPESEDFIRNRHDEVLSGVKHLHAALLKRLGAGERADLAALGDRWTQDTLDAAQFTPKLTTTEDYGIRQVLPGIVRIHGESADGAARQSVLIDLELQSLMWETRQELPKVQSMEIEIEYED